MLKLRLSLAGEAISGISLAFLELFEGVGMIRSEYLLRRTDEYVTVPRARDAIGEYVSAIARLFRPRPVWYRTTDLWTDEANTLIGVDEILDEPNPAIGMRGLRRALRCREAFRFELSRLLEIAQRHDNVHLLLPYVGGAVEFAWAMDIIREIHWPNRVGSMIEIPSAILDVEGILEAGASNLMIGMNDLTCLMTGSARNSAFGGKMHRSVWWCIEYLKEHTEGRAEWGIAGDLTKEVLDQAEARGVPYASVHYSQAPALLGVEAAKLPDVDYVGQTKAKTRGRVRERQRANECARCPTKMIPPA